MKSKSDGFDWRCADILFPLKLKNVMIGKKKKYSLSLTLVMVFIAAVLPFQISETKLLCYIRYGERETLCPRLAHNICAQIPVSLAWLDSTEH